MTSRSIQSELSLRGPSTDDLAMAAKKKVRMSSPERFEIKQLIAAGVIDKSELPDFDEESGLLPKVDSDDEDVEVELVEDEAPFLKGHGRMINDLSPVRYTTFSSLIAIEMNLYYVKEQITLKFSLAITLDIKV